MTPSRLCPVGDQLLAAASVRSRHSLRIFLSRCPSFAWQAERCIAIELVFVDPLPGASPGTVLRANRVQA